MPKDGISALVSTDCEADRGKPTRGLVQNRADLAGPSAATRDTSLARTFFRISLS